MPSEFNYQWPSSFSDEEFWEESERWESPASPGEAAPSVRPSAQLNARRCSTAAAPEGPHTADTTDQPGPRRPCAFPRSRCLLWIVRSADLDLEFSVRDPENVKVQREGRRTSELFSPPVAT